MKVEGLPEHVEPMIILGNDNDYLVVYTHMSNDDTIELLERSLQVLRSEKEVEAQSSGQLH